MDAIVKATQQHYLDNSGQTGSDTEQMKKLYDAAIDASKNMEIKVGIALTADQIANLQEDILWYVEKVVEGNKVLVPELYLSQATLASIDNNKGSKIAGSSVGIEADYIANYGTVSAQEQLVIHAKEVLNETNDREVAKIKSEGNLIIEAEGTLANLSGEISGAATKITAGELINETKVLSEDRSRVNRRTSETYHIEEAAPTALISGLNGLFID
jgi:filamentous hemagglutinin